MYVPSNHLHVVHLDGRHALDDCQLDPVPTHDRVNVHLLSLPLSLSLSLPLSVCLSLSLSLPLPHPNHISILFSSSPPLSSAVIATAGSMWTIAISSSYCIAPYSITSITSCTQSHSPVRIYSYSSSSSLSTTSTSSIPAVRLVRDDAARLPRASWRVGAIGTSDDGAAVVAVPAPAAGGASLAICAGSRNLCMVDLPIPAPPLAPLSSGTIRAAGGGCRCSARCRLRSAAAILASSLSMRMAFSPALPVVWRLGGSDASTSRCWSTAGASETSRAPGVALVRSRRCCSSLSRARFNRAAIDVSERPGT